MSNAPKSDQELFSAFLDGVLSGRLTGQDVPRLPREKLGACWRWALHALGRGPNDPRLVEAISQLARVDPEFPLGQYLLGLACRKVGRLDDAKRAFANQTRHPSGAHAAQAREMLNLLGA